MGGEVEAVLAGEDEVALEAGKLFLWNVLTVVIDVLLGEAEIDKVDFALVLFRVYQLFRIADHDVI